jgi:UbiD family decarboxylase
MMSREQAVETGSARDGHLRDLRAFCEALKDAGDLLEIDVEVDSNLEIGAIIRRSYDLRAPAPLFNRIKGVAPGFRALGAPGGISANPQRRFARIALALGLPAEASGGDIIRRMASALDRPFLPPRVVSAAEAPCKENILVGDAVDLLRFPTPYIHRGDGGRYIQTYGLNIVRTPDGSWTNASINRMMLVDRNRLACLIPPAQHLGIIHEMYRVAGEPTPIAVVLGTEPAIPYVGGMPLAQGVSELEYIGAVFGEPVPVVPCETVPLEVPATAEIVIEGHISHTDTIMEGPMGEFPGYRPEPVGSPKPVLYVSAVTYRNNPILPIAVAGPPVEEDHTGWGIPHAAECLHRLQSAGLPATLCWMVLESANHWLAVSVPLNWHETTGLSGAEFAEKIGNTIFHSKAGFGVPKIILVEDDVDITSVDEVVWAFATRSHPSRGGVYFENEAQNNLGVFLNAEEHAKYHVTKVVHNCLLGDTHSVEDRPVAGSLANTWPPEIQERVISQWHAYGYQ